jgi:hypothetical protein
MHCCKIEIKHTSAVQPGSATLLKPVLSPHPGYLAVQYTPQIRRNNGLMNLEISYRKWQEWQEYENGS